MSVMRYVVSQAEAVYERGAKAGLFRSKYQRSLYNVDRLQSRPFWTAQQAKVTSYVQVISSHAFWCRYCDN